ncbi:MAG: disulfide bond formation protein B [Rhodospirillaceae bacterium]
MSDTAPAPVWQMHVPGVLILVAVAALGSAYTAQYAYGLEPCVLCLYQRIPYAVLGVMGVFGLRVRDARRLAWLTAAAGVVLLIGAAVAFYHVGVEQHWWASAASCGGGAPDQAIRMNQFQAMLQQKPEKACDEVDWTLFGISMATYNAVGSTLLGAAALAAAKRMRDA